MSITFTLFKILKEIIQYTLNKQNHAEGGEGCFLKLTCFLKLILLEELKVEESDQINIKKKEKKRKERFKRKAWEIGE